MKSSQTLAEVVVQGNPTLSTVSATGLVFDIVGFRDEVVSIAERGKATLSLMERMGATPERIEKERQALRQDVLTLRLRVTAQFSEVVGKVVRDSGLS
jgi:hypothetical protein